MRRVNCSATRKPIPHASGSRRVLRWALTTAAIVTALAGIFSRRIGVDFAVGRLNVEVGGCGIFLSYIVAPEDFFTPHELFVNLYRRPASYSSFAGRPRWGHSPGWWDVWAIIPMWLVFVVLAIPAIVLWWRDLRARVPAGCCAVCGYCLEGNVSGRCPECGTAVARTQEREVPSKG